MKQRFTTLFVTICLIMCAILPIKSEAADDYRAWSQRDPRWANLILGGVDQEATVANYGCAASACTKMIIQARLKSADEFDIGTFVNLMNATGGFTSGGAIYWGNVSNVDSRIIPQYSMLSGYYNADAYNQTLMGYLQKGYHLVIAVNNWKHWVVVDEETSLATGKVYIWDSDPASTSAPTGKTLAEAYGTFNEVQGIREGTPRFWTERGQEKAI